MEVDDQDGVRVYRFYQNAVRAKAAPSVARRETAVPARAFFLMSTSTADMVFNLYLLVSASVVESF